MSTDTLREEHQRLRREASRQRRAFQRSPLGTMARQLEDAMTEYHKMRSEGVSREDAVKGLELVLRECWPKRPTKFPPQCSVCEDLGWREKVCTHNLRCGRYWCSLAEPSYEHRYVTPCDCPAGDKLRPKLREAEEALTAVGKTQKKKRGFVRVGE